eukprot:4129837-Prymnesium_polylepis.1
MKSTDSETRGSQVTPQSKTGPVAHLTNARLHCNATSLSRNDAPSKIVPEMARVPAAREDGSADPHLSEGAQRIGYDVGQPREQIELGARRDAAPHRSNSTSLRVAASASGARAAEEDSAEHQHVRQEHGSAKAKHQGAVDIAGSFASLERVDGLGDGECTHG